MHFKLCLHILCNLLISKPCLFQVLLKLEDTISVKYLEKEMDIRCSSYSFPNTDDIEDLPIGECYGLKSLPICYRDHVTQKHVYKFCINELRQAKKCIVWLLNLSTDYVLYSMTVTMFILLVFGVKVKISTYNL